MTNQISNVSINISLLVFILIVFKLYYSSISIILERINGLN